MKTYKITCTQTHLITSEDVNDLMVTAFEGGINYWCGAIKPIKVDGKYKGVPEEYQNKVPHMSDIIAYGGELVLFDTETPEKWILTLPNVLEAIKRVANEFNIPPMEVIEGDADIADRIVQYAIFNEIIFV